MKVSATVYVLAKIQKPWTAQDGSSHISYSANIMQDNGEIISTIKLTQEQYDAIEASKNYTVSAIYGIGKNGGYLKLVGISQVKTTN